MSCNVKTKLYNCLLSYPIVTLRITSALFADTNHTKACCIAACLFSEVIFMGKKKFKEKKQPAPVLTGHDERAERRSSDRREFERESDAPDGVTGNWS